MRERLKELINKWDKTESLADYLLKNGVLSAGAMQACANQLIGLGVFKDEKDMKLEAIKSYYIILPDWIFIGKRSDNDAEN